jgi:hypothetical protein
MKIQFPGTKFREKTDRAASPPLKEKTLYTEEEFLNWCRDGDLLTYYSGEFDILVVNRTTALPVSAGLYSRLLPKDDGGDFDMEVVAVIRWVHCKKRLSFFPSPAGMSLTKPSLAGNDKLFLARESLVSDLPAGDGEIDILFLQCKARTRNFPARLYFSYFYLFLSSVYESFRKKCIYI